MLQQPYAAIVHHNIYCTMYMMAQYCVELSVKYITNNYAFSYPAHILLLIDQLLVLQKQSLADDKTTVPRVQSIDEVEKLAGALRRIDAGKTVLENPNDCLSCIRTTNRCFHATHAYTGVPCAAYSEYDATACTCAS